MRVLKTSAFFVFTGRTLKDEEVFYRKIVGKPGERRLIFFSKRMLENVQPDDILMSDDTYKIRPRINGCSHVFIISLVAYNSVSKFTFKICIITNNAKCPV